MALSWGLSDAWGWCMGKCSAQFAGHENCPTRPRGPRGPWISSLFDFTKPWAGNKEQSSESRVRPESKFWPWPYFLCDLRKLLRLLQALISFIRLFSQSVSQSTITEQWLDAKQCFHHFAWSNSWASQNNPTGGTCCYYLHFTNGEPEIQGEEVTAQVTQLVGLSQDLNLGHVAPESTILTCGARLPFHKLVIALSAYDCDNSMRSGLCTLSIMPGPHGGFNKRELFFPFIYLFFFSIHLYAFALDCFLCLAYFRLFFKPPVQESYLFQN